MHKNPSDPKSADEHTLQPQATPVEQIALHTTILDSIADGFVVCDKEWQCIYINASAARIADTKEEYLIGKSLSELFPEWVNTPVFRVREQQSAETEDPLQFEYFSTGTGQWIEVIVHPSSQGAALFLIDITERKKAEEGQRLLAAIVETSVDAIISKNLNGIITSWNSAAERLFGYQAQEVIGQPITIIIPPELHTEEVEIIHKIKNGMRIRHYETVRVRKDGERVPISLSISPIVDSGGNIIGAAKVARDITQQKNAEAALKASEVRFRTLFDVVPVAVYTCDAEGVIQEFNQSAVKLWGREPERGNPKEKFCGSLKTFYPDGTFMPHGFCPMARVLRGETLAWHELEILIERPDGSQRNVIPHPHLLRNERGDITGAINCLYDITELRQTEQLRDQQARELTIIEERQRLARELHDAVSQSLFSANLIAEALSRLWGRNPEKAVEQLSLLHQLTRGAEAEMRSLLLELRPENILRAKLGELLTQLTNALQARKAIAASVVVNGDDTQFLPEDVHLTIYRIAQESLNNVAKHGKAKQVRARLVRTPDQVELTIVDNGQGFDAQQISSGFGLTSMRERAASIHASLQVKTRPGMGTRVKLIWKSQTVEPASV